MPVVTGAKPAEKIRARARRRQNDQATLGIPGHRRPDVRMGLRSECLLFARFAAAVLPLARGIGSKSPRASPVRTSNARTEPAGAATRALSLIAEPTTTTSFAISGGDVIWYSPGHQSSMPGSMRTSPCSPKSVHASPVIASTAIRARVVGAHENTAGAGSLAPRHRASKRHRGKRTGSRDAGPG